MINDKLYQEKFDRLPKWARMEINRLSGDLENYKQKVAQISGKEETNVYCEGYATPRINLPKNSHVTFDIVDGLISANVVDGELRVYGQSRWPLLVLPRASNSVYLIFGER